MPAKAIARQSQVRFLEGSSVIPSYHSQYLNREQEEKLLEVLRKHKKAIGWTLADLLGINPSICMHKILLEEGARPNS
ncbi:hypothetical protein CR513_02290, partial [Mucuna pruriens]